MQKQQSGGIKQPITPAGRRSRCDFPSVRETCRRCRGIDRQSTDLIVNQDRRANREINSLSAINRATTAFVTSPATELKCVGWWTEYVEFFFFKPVTRKFVKRFSNCKNNVPPVTLLTYDCPEIVFSPLSTSGYNNNNSRKNKAVSSSFWVTKSICPDGSESFPVTPAELKARVLPSCRAGVRHKSLPSRPASAAGL